MLEMIAWNGHFISDILIAKLEKTNDFQGNMNEFLVNKG